MLLEHTSPWENLTIAKTNWAFTLLFYNFNNHVWRCILDGILDNRITQAHVRK